MPTLYQKQHLAFNDILLVPQYSDIKSRLDVDLTTRLTNNIKIKHPICSTNMSTVTEFQMMKTMFESGSCGFLHRFLPIDKILYIIDQAKEIGIYPIVISIGVKPIDYENINLIMKRKNIPDVLLIDIAHGDCILMHNIIQYIKSNYDIDIIAGNIATKEAAYRLCKLKVNAIRVGVGGSACCLTRTVTGSGMCTLQSIIDCHKVTQDYNIPIIGDGGFYNSGDIVKALAFGAESVSLGTLLSSTSDTPGEIITVDNIKMKKVFGMASKDAQEMYYNGIKEGIAPEGKSMLIPYKGNTIDILNELIGGIRSGLTYSGAHNLKELYEKAKYIILSEGGRKESKI